MRNIDRTTSRDRISLLVALLAFITACSAPHQDRRVSQTTPTPTPARHGDAAVETRQKSPSPEAAFKAMIHEGMSYGDFRERALELGWRPVKDPACATRLTGEDEAYCAANSDLMLCRACNEIPEIHEYSSDGRSMSVFRHSASGRTVTVYGLGELQYWNEKGADTGFGITGWEFKPGS